MGALRDNVVDVLRYVFHYYGASLLFLTALIIFVPLPYVAARISWFAFAWILLAAAYFLATPHPELLTEWRPQPRTLLLALGGLFLLTYFLRLLPLGETVLPIGYDYGFYEAAMEHYQSPRVPEALIPPWIKLQFEPGLLLLHQVLFQVAGLTSFDHLRALWPLLSALLIVPLYATTRTHFGQGAGLAAAGFFAVSFTQYTVYEYLYEKNVLALVLLLSLFLSLHHRRFILAGILLGALGIWHRPTLLLAAAALVAYAAYDFVRTREWRGWSVSAALGILLFLPLWLIRADDYFDLGVRVIQSAGDNVGAAVPEGGGTFLNFIAYQRVAITYIPLGLAGIVLALRRRIGVLPAAALLFCFANVTLKLFFFNRFLIMLDLVSLLLVAAALVGSVPLEARRLRPILLAVLLFLTSYPTLLEATHHPGPPYLWITDAQREGILWIRDHTESNATLIASNLDSPYVIADSGRRTFGPGLFDDPHTGTEWRRFFQTTDREDVDLHFRDYPRPVYVYHANGHGPGLGLSKFVEPQFTQVYAAEGAFVWRYNE